MNEIFPHRPTSIPAKSETIGNVLNFRPRQPDDKDCPDLYEDNIPPVIDIDEYYSSRYDRLIAIYPTFASLFNVNNEQEVVYAVSRQIISAEKRGVPTDLIDSFVGLWFDQARDEFER